MENLAGRKPAGKGHSVEKTGGEITGREKTGGKLPAGKRSSTGKLPTALR